MVDFVRDFDPVPRTSRIIHKKSLAATQALSHRLFRMPSFEELAEETGIPSDSLARALRNVQPVESISQSWEFEPVWNGRREVEEMELLDLWQSMRRYLPPREQCIMDLHVMKRMTIPEIAKERGQSHGWIFHLIKLARERCAQYLRRQGLVS